MLIALPPAVAGAVTALLAGPQPVPHVIGEDPVLDQHVAAPGMSLVVDGDRKEVLADLVEKLRGKLELKSTSAIQAEAGPRGQLSPNLNRLTVGLDLGDQWSHFCILGFEGETLSEGQLQTREAEVAEFFQALPGARVVMEVGTHSPWMQEIIAGEGHEVVVANPRLMEGSKRRKRKNDRIDAKKLARLGRVDPQSLYPIRHRSREVRQDLVVLRARDALVADRVQRLRIHPPQPRQLLRIDPIILRLPARPLHQPRVGHHHFVSLTCDDFLHPGRVRPHFHHHPRPR